jgi:8-amino-7-oxononanoate synthase
LIVDEAHAIGVFGDCGRGVCNAKSVNDDNVCLLGTMSKALGCYGGIFSGSNLAKSYLINTSRPFIFNTALPPIIASPARAALKILRENPELGSKVQSSASLFRTRLLKAGLDCCGSQSHIVPILIGDNRKCLVFSELLYEQGFSALAIRPPTVPQGTARLRFSITANHRPEILDRLAELVIATASKLELN